MIPDRYKIIVCYKLTKGFRRFECKFRGVDRCKYYLPLLLQLLHSTLSTTFLQVDVDHNDDAASHWYNDANDGCAVKIYLFEINVKRCQQNFAKQ